MGRFEEIRHSRVAARNRPIVEKMEVPFGTFVALGSDNEEMQRAGLMCRLGFSDRQIANRLGVGVWAARRRVDDSWKQAHAWSLLGKNLQIESLTVAEIPQALACLAAIGRACNRAKA